MQGMGQRLGARLTGLRSIQRRSIQSQRDNIPTLLCSLVPAQHVMQIREAGSSAVREGEQLFAKWVKFFGIVAFLTVVLLPLPSVHVTITAG